MGITLCDTETILKNGHRGDHHHDHSRSSRYADRDPGFARALALPGARGRRRVHRLVGDFRSMDGYSWAGFRVLPHADSGRSAAAYVAMGPADAPGEFADTRNHRAGRLVLRAGPRALQHRDSAHLRWKCDFARKSDTHLCGAAHLARISAAAGGFLLAGT